MDGMLRYLINIILAILLTAAIIILMAAAILRFDSILFQGMIGVGMFIIWVYYVPKLLDIRTATGYNRV